MGRRQSRVKTHCITTPLGRTQARPAKRGTDAAQQRALASHASASGWREGGGAQGRSNGPVPSHHPRPAPRAPAPAPGTHTHTHARAPHHVPLLPSTPAPPTWMHSCAGMETRQLSMSVSPCWPYSASGSWYPQVGSPSEAALLMGELLSWLDTSSAGARHSCAVALAASDSAKVKQHCRGCPLLGLVRKPARSAGRRGVGGWVSGWGGGGLGRRSGGGVG